MIGSADPRPYRWRHWSRKVEKAPTAACARRIGAVQHRPVSRKGRNGAWRVGPRSLRILDRRRGLVAIRRIGRLVDRRPCARTYPIEHVFDRSGHRLPELISESLVDPHHAAQATRPAFSPVIGGFPLGLSLGAADATGQERPLCSL
jgi:hypothetical protein